MVTISRAPLPKSLDANGGSEGQSVDLGVHAVRARGLEPPRDHSHRDLNPARLPFRHTREVGHLAIEGPRSQSEGLVGRPGLEPGTLCLRGICYCQLS